MTETIDQSALGHMAEPQLQDRLASLEREAESVRLEIRRRRAEVLAAGHRRRMEEAEGRRAAEAEHRRLTAARDQARGPREEAERDFAVRRNQRAGRSRLERWGGWWSERYGPADSGDEEMQAIRKAVLTRRAAEAEAQAALDAHPAEQTRRWLAETEARARADQTEAEAHYGSMTV